MEASEAMTAAPTTRPMTLIRLVTEWRPGSHDWTWPEEYAQTPEGPVLAERMPSHCLLHTWKTSSFHFPIHFRPGFFLSPW